MCCSIGQVKLFVSGKKTASLIDYTIFETRQNVKLLPLCLCLRVADAGISVRNQPVSNINVIKNIKNYKKVIYLVVWFGGVLLVNDVITVF
jgi:hypothetical protein